MRAILFIVLVFLTVSARAQLINGSFEAGGAPSLAGWTSTCACIAPASSADVPGGTGNWSVRLNAQHSLCICSNEFPLAQALPWITSGTWVLSGWIKGVSPDTWEGTTAIVFGGTPFTGDHLGGIAQLDSVWSYESNTIVIPPGYPADSLRLILVPAGLTNFGPNYAYYDELTLDQATGAQEVAATTPAFRVEGGGDRIWVDLAEAPGAVWLVDAIGRRLPLRTSHYTGHTLQVDLPEALSGLVVLVISTSAGPRTVRFVKHS